MSGAIPEPGTPEFEAALEWRTGEDERHVTRTNDGWTLGLYRYRPRPGSPERPFPVVMGHGLAGSRLIFDVHERYSMARALAAAGFDTWLVDLRGRNESWPDGGPDEALQWTFDDFVFRDIPAAVAEARRVTGAEGAFWVGTEMSGIALYAVALSETVPGLLGGITLGSPAVTPADAQVPGVTTPFPERAGTRYPFSMVKEVGPILAAQGSEHIESSFRPADTDWVVAARYFRHGVPDECTAIVDQFKDWIDSGTMRSVDRSVVWSDRLAEMTLPVLVMAAARDLQRPPGATQRTFEAIGSVDKELVVAAEPEWPVDPGHDDLLCGLGAPDHTFPHMVAWLAARS
jgi:pimeloyl-ACP methyl ester carboxylesterase